MEDLISITFFIVIQPTLNILGPVNEYTSLLYPYKRPMGDIFTFLNIDLHKHNVKNIKTYGIWKVQSLSSLSSFSEAEEYLYEKHQIRYSLYSQRIRAR